MAFPKKMKGRLAEESTLFAVSAIVIAVVILLNAVVYALGARYGWYLSVRDEEDLSLSAAACDLAENLKSQNRRVTIAFCMAQSDLETNETGSYVLREAKEYAAAYPDVVDVTYWNIITRRDGDGDRFDPDVYATDLYGSKTGIATRSVVLLSGFKGDADFGATYKVMPDFRDFYILNGTEIASFAGEEMFGAMMTWLFLPERPVAYFTNGHNERFTLPLVNLLAAAGYRVDVVDLKTSDVPADAGLVVISGPESDFERAAAGSGIRTEIERLTDFVAGGGNILAFTHAYTTRSLPVLENFFASYGISYRKSEVGGTPVNTMVKDTENAITKDGYTLVPDFADTDGARAVKDTVLRYATSDTSGVLMREVAALTLSGDAKALLVTTRDASLAADGVTVDTAGNYTVGAYTETAGGTVVVLPCFYVFATDALVSNGYTNRDFLYATLGTLCGAGQSPVGMRQLLLDYDTLENLTMGAATRITLLLVAIPTVILAVGCVVLVRRKRR